MHSHIRYPLFYFLFFPGISFAQRVNQQWNVNLEEAQKIFIENKGQFDDVDNISGSNIVFGMNCSGLQMYFTHTGLIYRFDKVDFRYDDGREKKSKYSNDGKYFNNHTGIIRMDWLYSSPGVIVMADDVVPEYYSYPFAGNPVKTVHARAYKKLVYKNLYDGIDVEYTFLDNEGIKYTIVLHPGADASKIKMKYTGADQIFKDIQGNLNISTTIGGILDHAPVTWQQGVQPLPLSSSFMIKGDIVSFKLDQYDHSKSVIVDPWTINPSFTVANKGYDIAQDKYGNVYVYGGGDISFSGGNYTLKKFSSSGSLVWSFSTSSLVGTWYGDFAIDLNGTSYITDGAWGGTILKVDPSGTLVFNSDGGLQQGNCELWRVVFDCNNGRLMTGGYDQIQNVFVAIIDTSTGLVSNITDVVSGSDRAEPRSMAVDDLGNLYSVHVEEIPYGSGNGNLLIKSVPPSFSVIFSVQNGYSLGEDGIFYTSTNGFAGFNGVAVNQQNIFLYDGQTIQKRDKNNGSLISSVLVTGGTAGSNSGLAVDNCSNIFVGTANGVTMYNSSLLSVSSASTSGAVYDLCIGNDGKILACGDGFVASLSLFSPCVDTSIFTLSASSTQSTCTGNDGSATVAVTGGIPPYTYLWLPGGQTTATITGLSPGYYYVEVRDSIGGGCIENDFNADTIIVTAASGFSMQSHTVSSVSCFGGNDGAASINITGGTPPYTYQWSNGGSQSSVSGLNAGIYSVTVYDAAGCGTLDSMTVNTSSSALAVTAETENIFSCNGTNWVDGNIDLDIAGGVLPYTYSWSTGATTQDLPAVLSPGIYSVTVTEASGCSMVLSPEVEQIIVDWYVTSVDIDFPCSAATATVRVHLGGYFPGTLTFTWYDSYANWIPGDSVISNLSTGNYLCDIVDNLGCIDTFFSVAISNPTVAAVITSINPGCYGSTDGTASVNVVSGVPPYTYLWSNGGSQSAISNLQPAIYTVTVTDSKGCTTVKTTTLTEPAVLKDSLAVMNTVCGTSNGNAIVYTTGGTGSYTWQWSTGATVQSISNLAAGIYFITVFDANNCTISDTTIVAGIGNVSTSPLAGNTLCYGSANGWIDITASGGTPPYQYLWSNNAATEDISGISAGIYLVSITDNDSCLTVDTFTITQPDSLYLTTYSAKAGCSQSDGYAWVEAGGGTPGYGYLWDNFTTDDTLAGVPSGNYYVTVTDLNGCSKTSFVAVDEAIPPTIVIDSIKPVSCYGGSDGRIAVGASDGNPPYSYLWSNGDTDSVAEAVSSGIYSVTLTDSASCTAIINGTITEPIEVTVSTSSIPAGCTGGGEAMASAAGGSGSYSYLWSNGGASATLSALNAGIYSVTVTDTNECAVSDSVNVLLNGSITAGISGNSALCTGQSVQLTAFGGGSYLWSTGDTTVTINAAPIATGFITVVAIEGICSDTVSIYIIVYPAVSVNAGNDTTIYIGDHAVLIAAVSGGTPAYSYLWSPGNQNIPGMTVNPDETTEYVISLIDANGCKAVDSVLVEVRACDAEVFVPNAFAPDCRCPDEKLYVFSDCIQTMQLTIFDRWGEKVFGATDQKQGWDGTFKGKPMDIAVYMYILEYTTINEPDKTVKVEGNVNLIR